MPIDKPRGFFAALLIGLLALPVAAIAMSRGPSEESPTPEAEALVVATMEAVPAPGVARTEPGIVQACGADAQPLLEKERAGTLSALEQAALDALRPICAEAGLALPAPLTQPATDRTATQPLGTVATTSPTTTQPQQQWSLGQYDVIGGSAGIEFSVDQARVAFVNENPGFIASVDQPGPQDIEIRFSSSSHDSIITVTMANGEWAVTTTEQPRGGSSYDDQDDYDDYDDDGRREYDDDDDDYEEDD